MARRRRGAPRHRPTWHSGYGQHKAALHGSERPQFKGMSSHLRARHVVIAVEHMVASLQYEHWATWRGDVPTVRAARDDGRRAAQGSRTRWCAGPCKAAAATRRRLERAHGARATHMSDSVCIVGRSQPRLLGQRSAGDPTGMKPLAWSTWNWRKSGNLSQFFPDTPSGPSRHPPPSSYFKTQPTEYVLLFQDPTYRICTGI